MPRDMYGNYFSGADAMNLIAKTASLPRWKSCNIFMTESDIKEAGLSRSTMAVPCHLMHGKIYYNLAETNLPQVNPSLFEKVNGLSQMSSSPVSDYIKNLMHGLSGGMLKESEQIHSFVDKSVRREENDLRTAPSFAEMCMHLEGVSGRKKSAKEQYDEILESSRNKGNILSIK